MKLNVFRFTFCVLGCILCSACNYINNKMYDVVMPSYRMEIVLKNLDDNIERTIEILKIRFQEYDAKIEIDGKNILINIEDVKDTNAVKILLGNGKLEFFETYDNSLIWNYIDMIQDTLLRLPDEAYYQVFPGEIKKANNVSTDFSFLQEKDDTLDARVGIFKILRPNIVSTENGMEEISSESGVVITTPKASWALAGGPCVGYCHVMDTAKVNSIFKQDNFKKLFPYNLKLLWTANTVKSSNGDSTLSLIAIKTNGINKESIFSRNVVADCYPGIDEDGRPTITLIMNESGKYSWKNITAKLANQYPQGSIAVVLDDKVYSYPTVLSEIPNGSTSIDGNFSFTEAKILASVFRMAEPISIKLLKCKIVKE